LEFVTADLTSDLGWDQAVAGATFVLHTASPFPPTQPENEDDLIIPAREGTLRVLKAAQRAGVSRVVVTSSFAAVGYTRTDLGAPFTEEDWTDPATPGISAYVKSKTIAEKAAWEFVAATPEAPELVTVCPVAILGPVYSRDFASSIGMVQLILSGRLPGNPKLTFGVVDVRDVADLHIRAMTNPAAAGQRFLAVSKSPVSVNDMAIAIKKALPDLASKTKTRELPNWLLKIAARAVPALAPFTSELGKHKHISHNKASDVLGWTPRPVEASLVDTVRSLADVGLTGPVA
jgi:dihydroflavonol-4-reductase